jgi:serine/threonine-protein kinase
MTTVPNVVGQPAVDAAAALAEAGLEPRVVEINSSEEVNTVTGQFPRAGAEVVRGSRVRINVSKGPAQVSVPSVVGEPFEQANAELQAAGFSVARRDVRSNSPAGVVTRMEPGANTLAPKGSTVTLFVSRGPPTREVPDVTSQDRAAAEATLRASGFRVRVEEREVDDPSLDNFVLEQRPEPGTQLEPGETVTIVVGRAPPETIPEEEETLPEEVFP